MTKKIIDSVTCKSCGHLYILYGEEPKEYIKKQRFDMKSLCWELGVRAHIVNCIANKIKNHERMYETKNYR